MFQIDTKHFASDALEDAMRLAQVKALNSFTFSDCISFLNYAWSDIYSRMAMIDDGYYGTNVRLTKKLTKLPPIVKNTVQVYAAQSPMGFNRLVYREAGTTDMNASRVYKISGTDLYCPDAERTTVWLYYVPACPQIFFTHHNRDPKLYDNSIDSDGNVTYGHDIVRNNKYNLFLLSGTYTKTSIDTETSTATEEVDEDTNVEDSTITETSTVTEDNVTTTTTVTTAITVTDGIITTTVTTTVTTTTTYTVDITTADRDTLMGATNWIMTHRGTGETEDVTEMFAAAPIDDEDDGKWVICYISCDFPYIFVTYEHSLTSEHISGFFDSNKQFNRYNPFDFTGRNSDVEYLDCHWNDKTGLSAVIKDYNDLDENSLPRVKELGWTPDTQLDYPIPEMYRYLVARLADKLSALNESNIMGVQKELIEARFAFEAFLDKDKSAWKRITNVNPPNIGDWL